MRRPQPYCNPISYHILLNASERETLLYRSVYSLSLQELFRDGRNEGFLIVFQTGGWFRNNSNSIEHYGYLSQPLALAKIYGTALIVALRYFIYDQLTGSPA